MAVALAAAFIVLIAPWGAAASVVRGPGYATRVTFLGIEVVNGVRTVCIDSSAARPNGLQAGVPLTDPRTAYLLHRYASTRSDTIAAALAYLVKKKYDSNRGAADAALSQRPERAQIRAAITRLTEDAAANAGPYVVRPTISAAAGTVPTKGTVSAQTGPTGTARYAAVPGVTTTLTLSGPAVFDGTGRSTVTVPSARVAAVGWHATGQGRIHVAAVTRGLPPTTFVVHRRQAPGYQRVVSVTPTPASATGGAVLASPVTTRFSPAVSTQLQVSTVLGPGRSVRVSDRVRVTHAPPRSTVPVVVEYYWTPTKPTRATTIPSAAVLLGRGSTTVHTDGAGQGSGLAPGPAVTRPWGWVTAVESIPASLRHNGFRGDFGMASESTQLPTRPVASTVIQAQPVAPGRVTLRDRVVVNGATPRARVGVEVRFYLDQTRPVEAESAPATATLAGVATVMVATDDHGAGTATAVLSDVAISRTSWVVAVEHVPATAATADTPAVLPYQAPYGQATESALVCRPVPSTELQRQLLPGGSRVRLFDRVRVTGACPNSTVTVAVPFYLDSSRPAPAPTVPSTAHLVGTATVHVRTNAQGEGTAIAHGPEVAVPTRGAVWAVGMESIAGAPGSPSAAATLPHEGTYGQAAETVQISAPQSPSTPNPITPRTSTPVPATSHPTAVLINAGVPHENGRGAPLRTGAVLLVLVGAASGAIALGRRGPWIR